MGPSQGGPRGYRSQNVPNLRPLPAAGLVSMSQRAEIPQLTWDDLSVSELLPTGTVTLLLADVEGSTRLWETQPERMTAALAELNRTVNTVIAAHDGVRPLEQGEGDSFVAAFARASDAVACALALQLAPLAPIRLRIGVHTGEIQLSDEANYAGPTINRTARLRDLAHGGQTVLSGATEPLVLDHLPAGVWLADLGSYPLRDLPRPERVVQLCHPDLHNEFPPLRVRNVVAAHHFPAQLTSFVGRVDEMTELRAAVTGNRLTTLTGAGGAGKTRLAMEVAAGLTSEFPDGLWNVDLAPITNSFVVPVTVARALDLPDEPGRSIMDQLVRSIGEKAMLLVLDNCEHLLDACGAMVVELLATCTHLTILATSREPLSVPGELSWRVPSLSVADEAIELFTDRARHARPDFVVDEHNVALVTEICERLDGMPLAIELAAARIRALSLNQIVDSLHDRFRLLTGGARTAVRRQQTLRASVDWSFALLTETEQVLFRRLAVFAGGFDLDAVQDVGASSEIERFQVLDQLSLLVDKSLVVAFETGTAAGDGMRYRLLETVRQYAQEKLTESGEANEVRNRHRDHYTAAAAAQEARGHAGDEELLLWAQAEVDNVRAAFAWSRENSDLEMALLLISSLRPLWLRGGRVMEALAGFDAILSDGDHSKIEPAVWVRAVAHRSILSAWVGLPCDPDRAQKALAIAREIDDPKLISRALIACGMLTLYRAEQAQQYFSEAIKLVRAAGDLWSECQIFSYQATAAIFAGDPVAAVAAGEQGLAVAAQIGDRFFARNCRQWLGCGLAYQGFLHQACQVLRDLIHEAEAAGDLTMTVFGHTSHGGILAYRGAADAALAAAKLAHAASEAMGGIATDTVHSTFTHAHLARGDARAAWKSAEMALAQTVPLREAFIRSATPNAEAALAGGDLVAARQRADQALAVVPGWYRVPALTVSAYIAVAQSDPERADRDAHDALVVATQTRGYTGVGGTLECLARLASDEGNHAYAARLLGAASTVRKRMENPRYPMYQDGHDELAATVQDALGSSDFDSCWRDGCAMSTEEAIAYAQHSRGERERPPTG